MKKLKFQIIEGRHPVTPDRGHKYDAGIDFYVPMDFSRISLPSEDAILIKSGLRVNVPKGFVLIAFNKSGVATGKSLSNFDFTTTLSLHSKSDFLVGEQIVPGLIIGGQVIDHGYQGEINLHLINMNYSAPISIYPGMKIAQFILIPISNAEPIIYSSDQNIYDELSDRGENGFGSTNKLK